jgi:hypothetical protein
MANPARVTASSGAINDRKAIATMRNTAATVANSSHGKYETTIRPCSTRAGIEPVTPTTASFAS